MINAVKQVVKKLRQLHNTQRSVCANWSSLQTFLSFSHRTQPGFEGSLRPEELEFLNQLVRSAHDFSGPIVEVGTLFGFTTQSIANWKDPEEELITIDDYSWNPVGMVPLAHQDFARRSLFI